MHSTKKQDIHAMGFEHLQLTKDCWQIPQIKLHSQGLFPQSLQFLGGLVVGAFEPEHLQLAKDCWQIPQIKLHSQGLFPQSLQVLGGCGC